MLLAKEAVELTKKSYRADAVRYAIETTEDKIRANATRGNRSCIIRFCSYPGKFNDFIKQYGEEYQDDYKEYDVEIELKEYFTKNGFTFKLVADDVCGGVQRSPYWTICW